MRNVIVLVLIVLLGLWGSSFFFPQVKQLIQKEPVVETTIDTSIVAPIPLPKPDFTEKVVQASKSYVQFGSFKTKDSAFVLVRELKPIYGELEVRRAKLQNGIWFRVVKPFGDVTKADALCAEVKASGRDCLVLQF